MSQQIYPDADGIACFSSLLRKATDRDLSKAFAPVRQPLQTLNHSARRVAASVLVLPLLTIGSVTLAAQQQYGGYSSSPYPQGGTYGQQYPDQQPGYSQSPDSQPAPQQQYAPPHYSQQPPQQPLDDGPPYGDLDQNNNVAQPPAPALRAGQLEQMLAPIALYPDALVAQILAAATYPAQVSLADQWIHNMRGVSPELVAAEADAQNWDPSVKALTAFPQVLDLMNHDLAWTTDLGNAYYNQPQDVLQTVQVLRRRAQAAGSLQSTPQEQVIQDRGNIELAPPDPNTVYVPQYNPWNVYGQPIQPYPGFSLLGAIGSIFGSSPIQYGLGIAMSAFTHTPFGWLSWALDWLGHSVLFNHSAYYSQSTTVAHWRSLGWQGRNGQQWAGRDRRNNGYNRQQYGYNEYDRPRVSSYDSTRESGNSASDRFYPGNRFSTYPSRPSYDSGYSRAYANNVRPAPPQGYPTRSQPVMPVRPQAGYEQRSFSPQAPTRPGYGSSFTGGGRSGAYYAGPEQSWRATEQRSFASHGGFGQQTFSQPRNSFFSHSNSASSFKPESSGGFHLFGGGNRSPHFSAPKPPKNFGGGSHSGGGHFSSHGGSRHHH
jgi:hypothetical protein